MGELSFELNSSTLVMIRYPIIPVPELIKSFPMKLNEPPIKKSMLHLPKFLMTRENPSKAALQKLWPVSAI